MQSCKSILNAISLHNANKIFPFLIEIDLHSCQINFELKEKKKILFGSFLVTDNGIKTT